MVRHASLFSQLVALFNRQKFYELVFMHKAERYSKGFGSWDHFIAMLFCQSAQAKSLREICGGLVCCMGKLKHLGMVKLPTNRHFHMPMRTAPGKCFVICSTKPCQFAVRQHRGTTSSDLRTNCLP